MNPIVRNNGGIDVEEFDLPVISVRRYLKSTLGLKLARNGENVEQNLNSFAPLISQTTSDMMQYQTHNHLQYIYSVAVGLTRSGCKVEVADARSFDKIIQACEQIIELCGNEPDHQKKSELAHTIKSAASEYHDLIQGRREIGNETKTSIHKSELPGMRHTLIFGGNRRLYEMTNSMSNAELR